MKRFYSKLTGLCYILAYMFFIAFAILTCTVYVSEEITFNMYLTPILISMVLFSLSLLVGEHFYRKVKYYEEIEYQLHQVQQLTREVLMLTKTYTDN